MAELEIWIHKKYMARTQLESIASQLQAVSNRVRPARLFISRLFNKIPKMSRNTMYLVDETMKKDLHWWRRFLPQYSRISMMWLEQLMEPDSMFATDACLTGIGGKCSDSFYHTQIPQWILDIPVIQIAHLELIAVMIGLKLWAPRLKGVRFQILCDKQATVTILNIGGSRDYHL